MDLICPLRSVPHTMLDLDGRRLALASADGLAVLDDADLAFLDRGRLDRIARGPGGCIYGTRTDSIGGSRILRFDADSGGEPVDITETFAGRPGGEHHVVCTADGTIWVEGCTTRRRLDGSFETVPRYHSPVSPAPRALDVYGNFWSLAGTPADRQVLVLPANAPGTWLSAWLPNGRWEHLMADGAGYVWAGGPEGWQRFCPRRAEAGWQAVVGGLPPGAVTAVGYSPDELVMVASDTGELIEIDTDAAGTLITRPLAALPSPGRCLHTGSDGAIWVATDDALYRRDPAGDAWQSSWTKQRGRLPGGGNHDIFSTACGGKLYVAGGWAGQWGLPPTAHVLDELFAYDPGTGYWDVVSRMREPRRYNGIAEMEGRVWIVGGETRTPGWEGEGQVLYTVDIHDPASASWGPGPSLNEGRTDPFVLSCSGRIYALGGAAHNTGPKLDSVESIGPGEDAWRAEPSMPVPTRQGHACALDGTIYCASIDGFYAFDTERRCWDRDLPQPGVIGQAPLVAAYRGEVWVMGGYMDRQTRRYSPGTRTWRSGPSLPAGLAWGAAAVMDGRLIIVGGAHWSELHQAIVFDDRTYVLRDGDLS